jgi:uncharacterized protein YcnI
MFTKTARRGLTRSAALAGAAALVGAAIGVFGFGSPAGAHVSVSSSDATQGGFAKMVFRVPNEEEAASTVKVEVDMADNPLATARPKPKVGWTAQITKGKLPKPVDMHGTQVTEGVTKITWTAANPTAGIPVDQFDEFEVSGGPMPEADSIEFKVLQTYSNNVVARWIEETEEGEEEPEHPAPVLELAKATGGEHGDEHGGTDSEEGGEAAGESGEAHSDSGDSGDNTGTILGTLGLATGVAGFVLGGLAFVRTRKVAPPPAD